MVKPSEYQSVDESLITQGVARPNAEHKAKYDTTSAEVQFRLAKYAADLAEDSFGLILGRKAEFYSFKMKQPLLIGRLSEDVATEHFFDLTPFDGTSLGVSRVHARLQMREQKLTVEDMNSRNGTYINGDRIDMFAAKQLRHADLLRFGNLIALVVLPKTSLDDEVILKLEAALAKEDCLAFMDEQLLPYLRALEDIQKLFNTVQMTSKLNDPKFMSVTVNKVTAIVQAKYYDEAVQYVKELEASQSVNALKPIQERVKGLPYVQQNLIRSGDILKLTNLSKTLLDALIQLDIAD